jgi:tRNA (adenine37-N6)-methyltransferase
MAEIRYQPIGMIHTPYESTKNIPIQPSAAKGIKGYAELDPKFVRGLKDLDGFSHIILVYHFHLSVGFHLEVRPFLDENKRGVFATRAPKRPNNIGISIVKIIGIEKNILHFENADMVNNTPLLDIKPYIPDMNPNDTVKTGWLTEVQHKMSYHKSDGRFDNDM